MNTANDDRDAAAPAVLLPLGDTAWTVEFGDRIDPALHQRVLGLAARIEARRAEAVAGPAPGSGGFGAVVDVVPTFRSLTVHYDPLRCDGVELGRELLRLAASAGRASVAGRQWLIPVCFDEALAPDLADLARAKQLTPEAVVELMTQTEFRVYMIGFMPGFPYMGGLPAALHMPRLASPRNAVPERSLAVANEMCAVYPWESPGGWRLLGRTPVPMFCAAEASPSLLSPGDRVRWRSIDRATHDAMEAAAKRGRFDRASLRLATGPGGR